MRRDIGILFLVLVVGAVCFVAGRKTAKTGGFEPISERVDTLVIRDTIVAYKPEYITKRVVDLNAVYAVLEREQVVWEDSLARVYASGINPQVDSVFHYRTEKVINHIVPVKVQSRWGLGVQGGVGFGKDGLTPYVGVGVSYNILSW